MRNLVLLVLVFSFSASSLGATYDHFSGDLRINFSVVTDVTIRNSKLSGVMGYRTEISQLFWENSSASSVEFSNGKLGKSIWKNSNITTLNCRGCDLKNAQFESMILGGCNFDRADLRGAQFSNTPLLKCSFHNAIYNDATKLPFDPKQVEEMTYVP
jgi:uncharacterized protein YjbI with pentapeptide repeats